MAIARAQDASTSQAGGHLPQSKQSETFPFATPPQIPPADKRHARVRCSFSASRGPSHRPPGSPFLSLLPHVGSRTSVCAGLYLCRPPVPWRPLLAGSGPRQPPSSSSAPSRPTPRLWMASLATSPGLISVSTPGSWSALGLTLIGLKLAGSSSPAPFFSDAPASAPSYFRSPRLWAPSPGCLRPHPVLSGLPALGHPLPRPTPAPDSSSWPQLLSEVLSASAPDFGEESRVGVGLRPRPSTCEKGAQKQAFGLASHDFSFTTFSLSSPPPSTWLWR